MIKKLVDNMKHNKNINKLVMTKSYNNPDNKRPLLENIRSHSPAR